MSRPQDDAPAAELIAELAAQIPDARALFSEIAVVSLPMVTRFRGITTRESMLVKGPAGWAEFSPFLEYDTAEAARWLRAAVESAFLKFPAPVRDTVPLNGTVPACPAAQVPAVLARYDGVGTVKVKVAEHGIASIDDDLARVRAVMGADSQLRIRLDANAAWSLADTRAALEAFAGLPGLLDRLDYVEQPVAAVEDLARVRTELAAKDLPIRIAADESIRKAEDPLRVAQLGAADHIIVKVQPLGGIRAAAAVVEQSGLSATVSSALDTSVGLSAGAALAAHLPCEYAAGLGTSSLFSEDVADPPLRAHRGVLPTGRVSPDPGAVLRLQAAPDRQEWWMRRLQACWEHLRHP